VAELLGFPQITQNSIDAVSDRDFVVEFLSAAALCQVHLSRLSEELVMWMSLEFGFIKLPDAFCTGSSIMPQKKNPDIPELVRGKSGRIIGDLVALLTVLKGLPLAYNKDMQEDKEPLFDGLDTLLSSLTVTARILRNVELRTERMEQALNQGYVVATDLADALVERGVSFRDAHRIVGEVVSRCSKEGIDLSDLPRGDLSAMTGIDADELVPYLDAESSVARRSIPGGPAPKQVEEAMRNAVSRAAGHRNTIDALRSEIDLSELLGGGEAKR